MCTVERKPQETINIELGVLSGHTTVNYSELQCTTVNHYTSAATRPDQQPPARPGSTGTWIYKVDLRTRGDLTPAITTYFQIA